MIRDTLELIQNGTRSMREMADRLGVGMEDLRQRLLILEEKGFIKKVTDQGGCSPIKCLGCHCSSGCGSAGGCAPSSAATYILTDKGKKVVESGS